MKLCRRPADLVRRLAAASHGTYLVFAPTSSETMEVEDRGARLAEVRFAGPPARSTCPRSSGIGFMWVACGSILIIAVTPAESINGIDVAAVSGEAVDASGRDLGFYAEGDRGLTPGGRVLVGFRRPVTWPAIITVVAFTARSGAILSAGPLRVKVDWH